MAAAVVLLLCVVAGAMGYNPFAFIWKWTEETILYRFRSSGELEIPEELDSEYRSLPEALEARGFAVSAAPAWIPSDFALEHITVRDDDGLERITAFYEGEGRSFRIQISQTVVEDTSMQVEKLDRDAVYEHNGMIYLLHTNTENIKALWVENEFLCVIYGELSHEELTHIIDSIQR